MRLNLVPLTYELINTTVAPSSNLVTVTANNPAGQTETSTGGTNQNVNPLPVPTPSPTPTPTPSPTPTPAPPPLPQLVVTNSQNPVGGGACSTITATVPAPVLSNTLITLTVVPSSASYGFATSSDPGAVYHDQSFCTIASGSSSCSTTDGVDLCAASSTVGSSFAVNGSASGYTSGSSSVTVVLTPLSASVGCGYPLPGTDTASSCTAVTASIPSALTSDLAVAFSIPTASTGASNYYFSSAYGGNTASNTDCTITAGSTSCNSTLLLCAGASTNNTSVPVTVSATGYSESTTSVSGSNPKYIFATNATYSGDLKTAGNGTDGYDGANKLCQAAANAGSITGPLSATWKAMLNTNNATRNCQYYKNTNQNPTVGNSNILGKANNSGNFVGTLQIPNASNGAKTNWNENGNQFPAGNTYVWTGQGTSCNNWTSSSNSLVARVGNASENSANWWSYGDLGCQYTTYMHLYCAQQ